MLVDHASWCMPASPSCFPACPVLPSPLYNDGPSFPCRRYDKSAYSGKGDRADASTWPQAQGPVDVVLFEGWMLGFAPVSDAAAAAADPYLVAVNAALRRCAWERAGAATLGE